MIKKELVLELDRILSTIPTYEGYTEGLKLYLTTDNDYENLIDFIKSNNITRNDEILLRAFFIKKIKLNELTEEDFLESLSEIRKMQKEKANKREVM